MLRIRRYKRYFGYEQLRIIEMLIIVLKKYALYSFNH